MSDNSAVNVPLLVIGAASLMFGLTLLGAPAYVISLATGIYGFLLGIWFERSARKRSGA